MKVFICDPHPESCQIWQELASSQRLNSSVFHNWEPLQRVDLGPNILVIDQSIFSSSFVDCLAELYQRHVAAKVIATGARLTVVDAVELMNAGACVVYEKPLERSRILSTLPSVIEKAAEMAATHKEMERLSCLFSTLTTREKDVLKYILVGTSNKDTAKLLSVSVRTIESRRAKVYRKLEATNLADLVRKVDRLERLQNQFATPKKLVNEAPSPPSNQFAPHFPARTTAPKFLGC